MRRLARRFGYRGTWLIVLGVIWCAIGVGFLIEPEASQPGVLDQMLPATVRAVLWLASGGAALATGLRGRRADDTWGHVALWVMPAIRCLGWSVSYLLWLFAELSPKVAGYFGVTTASGDRNGWLGALVWLVIIATVRLVAAWPNPGMLPPPPRGQS